MCGNLLPPPLACRLHSAAATAPAPLCPTARSLCCHWALQGTLRGYDQATNLILDECHERVYSSKAGWTRCLAAGWLVLAGRHTHWSSRRPAMALGHCTIALLAPLELGVYTWQGACCSQPPLLR